MAKQYKDKKGRAIKGWIYKNGRRIPIVMPSGKKAGEASSPSLKDGSKKEDMFIPMSKSSKLLGWAEKDGRKIPLYEIPHNLMPSMTQFADKNRPPDIRAHDQYHAMAMLKKTKYYNKGKGGKKRG